MKNRVNLPALSNPRVILLLIAWMLLSPAFGQPTRRSVDYHPGIVLLQSGTELNGKLSYDQGSEAVLLQSGGTIKAFSVHQVRSFQFAEEHAGVLRRFVPYEGRRGSRGRRLRFFEVVVAGPLSVLRRNSNPWQKNLRAWPSTQPTMTYDYETDFVYYVGWEGQLLPMSRFRKGVLPRLKARYPGAIAKLMKQKKASLLTLADQITLINAYNFLETGAPLPNGEFDALPISQGDSPPFLLAR